MFRKATHLKRAAALFAILTLLLGLLPVGAVFAQDEGTPTQEPAPAQEPAAEETAPAAEPALEESTPTDEPAVEDETPLAEEPAPDEAPVEEAEQNEPDSEPSAEDSVAVAVELLAETETVIENESGEVVPLVSEEASEVLSMPDPMYCPAGEVYGGPTCSPARATMAEAITDAAGLGGTIFVEAGTFSGFSLTGFNGADLVIVGGVGGGTTVFNSQIYLHDNAANITLSMFTAYGSNAGTETEGTSGNWSDDTPTLLALNNSGTITLQYLTIEHDDDTAIYIDDHSGDVVLDHVDADGKGNDHGTVIDNRSGSGDVKVNDSTFHSRDNDSLRIKSAGFVLLDEVTANGSGDDGADINNTAGGGNVVVMHSEFIGNHDIGLKIVSDGWISLFDVAGHDNKEIGGYLETSHEKVTVQNSQFNDYRCGYSQNIGLQIVNKNEIGHTTTLCNVTAMWNDDKQLKLISPVGSSGSNFVYNICDFNTSDEGCQSEIFVYGGKNWEEGTGQFVDTCPGGGSPGTHSGTYGCWSWFIVWWWKGSVVPVEITETHSNVSLNYWDMQGDVWTQRMINFNEDPTVCCVGCDLPACGDGAVQPGEDCDDGNTTSGDGCSAQCTLEFCGDQIVQEGIGEQCDDGGVLNGDGCNEFCQVEYCGDGVMQEGLNEECDDGNENNDDACSNECTVDWEVKLDLDPYCVQGEEGYRMQWVINNPNPFNVPVNWTITDGQAGAAVLTPGVNFITTTELGTWTMQVTWGGGGFGELTDTITSCTQPEDGGDVPTFAGGGLLIPVTGQDLAALNALSTGGVMLLGLGMLVKGLYGKFRK